MDERANFLIVSTGRTATKWLAHIMNKSKKWTVFHEPRGFRGDSYEKAMFIFKNPYYAEVNGALRLDFHKFTFKKAIISRDIKELAVSFANRYDYDEVFNRLKLLKVHNDYLIEQSKSNCVIDYHRMTTDINYLSALFVWCGIKDYKPVPEDMITKINKSEDPKYNDFNELPNDLKSHFFNLKIKNIEPNFKYTD